MCNPEEEGVLVALTCWLVEEAVEEAASNRQEARAAAAAMAVERAVLVLVWALVSSFALKVESLHPECTVGVAET